MAKATEESINLAKRIEEYSAKYAVGGQMGVVLNMVKGNQIANVCSLLKEHHLETLGVIPEDETIDTVKKESDIIVDAIKQFYFRLNLPQTGV